MPAPNPYALHPRETAARLGVSVSTLERWRAKKIGPRWVKLGSAPQSAIRYPATDLDLWLANRTSK